LDFKIQIFKKESFFKKEWILISMPLEKELMFQGFQL
jgi:hypothetical protein